MRKLGILVLGVENKDLGIFRGKVGKKALGCIRFTGTGLTDNYHVGVNTFGISAEEIDEYRYAVAYTEFKSAFVGNMCIDPGEGCGNRVTRDTTSLTGFGIVGGYLFHSVIYSSPNNSSLQTGTVSALGRRASHGCVRLTVDDASWIYHNCPYGITVVVQE